MSGGGPGDAGQVSDHRGAALMPDDLPRARVVIGDRSHDSCVFRDALAARGAAACIPSSRSRKIPIPHDPATYRRRHRIEDLFARLKDWRRIATTAAPTYLSPQS